MNRIWITFQPAAEKTSEAVTNNNRNTYSATLYINIIRILFIKKEYSRMCEKKIKIPVR